MKNITTTAQAINYARQANLTTVITDVDRFCYLEETYKDIEWSVCGEYGWYNNREEVEAMKFVGCELMEEEGELLIIIEDTGW